MIGVGSGVCRLCKWQTSSSPSHTKSWPLPRLPTNPQQRDGGPSPQVDEVLRLFESLKAAHHTVSARTNALHDTCERLVAERARLEEFAAAIRTRLAYFDELERVSSQFYAATLSVRSQIFVATLLVRGAQATPAALFLLSS